MSIVSAMYTGVSGLSSHSQAMAVISDNIANVNTVGYKSSRANFGDIVGGMIADERLGNGVAVTSAQTEFTQGSLLGTGSATDLALQGDGFFLVTPPGGGAPLYTRAGQFELDTDGFLVNQQGFNVQGFAADGLGQLATTTSNLQVPTTAIPPTPTGRIDLQANLDASEPVSAVPFDLTDPERTSQFQTSVTVYDSLGAAHPLELYFTKTSAAPQQWQVNVTAAAADVTPAPAGPRSLVGTGTVEFNPDGSLASNSLPGLNIPWANAAPGAITLGLGAPNTGGGTGTDGLTTYAGASAVSHMSQDGRSSGDLGGLEIGDDGIVTGRYSNGETRTLGQIATARFTAPDSLTRQGEGLYAATQAAGTPTIAAPGTAGHGSIVSGALEASNVDLAAEFVDMIAIQRGFQSNSRSISTADEMLSEIVNLKR